MSTSLPYPGLRPFCQDEADIFFGREEQIDQLLEKLGRSRFLAVVGPSGCGKSSLVRAGMIPALETGFLASTGSRWRVAEMRPGNRPLMCLADALLEYSVLGSEGPADADEAEIVRAILQATLRRGPLGLIEVLRESHWPVDTNLLLLVDQFEEIFPFRKEGDRDEADAFVALLLETSAQSEFPVYVVLTMRSDYLEECALFMGLPEALNENQFLPPRLTREQRRSAIVGPAKVFDGDIEPKLVNRLLNDMGADPDQLPLMQHVMMRIWTRAGTAEAQPLPESPIESNCSAGIVPKKRIITLEDYEAVGGLENALSNHADEAFQELDQEQQRTAEVLFRALGEHGSDTRRTVSLRKVAGVVAGVAEASSDEVDEVKRVVEVFRRPDRSFITPSAGKELKPDDVLDISHECLIRQWNRMNEWVKKEAESAETYCLLEKNSQQWKACNKEDDALYRSSRLYRALEWKEREKPNPSWAERYGGDFDLAMAFLDASEQAHRAKEEARRKAEKDKLKDANDKANLMRMISFCAGAMAIVFLILALWAIWQSREAKKAKREALSRQLAASALIELRDDPGLSLSLAFKAITTTSKDGIVLPEAERALHRALQVGGGVQPKYLSGHSGEVLDVAISPNGKHLATASKDMTARVWNVDRGKELYPPLILIGHAKEVTSVAFSAKGRYLATASADMTAKVWEAATGKKLPDLIEHKGKITGLAFSPEEENYLATASTDMTVKLWDVTTRKKPKTLRGHTAEIKQVVFSHNGKLLATAGWDRKAIVWDTATAKKLFVLKGHKGWVNQVAFSPNGKYVATASADATATVCEAATGKNCLILRDHTDEINGVAFNSDGTRLATASSDKTVKLWDTRTGKILKTLTEHSEGVQRVAFSPDGKFLVSATDSTVMVRDGETGRRLFVLPSEKGEIIGMALNDKLLATANRDNAATVWNMASGKEQPTLSEHDDKINGLAYSPDGQFLVTAGDDKAVIVWNLRKNERLIKLKGHPYWINDVAFSSDRFHIATATGDNAVRVWDIRPLLPTPGVDKEVYIDEVRPQTLPGRPMQVSRVKLAYSQNDGRIAAIGGDGTVEIWDATSNKKGPSLPVREGVNITCAAFSQDGKRLATARDDGKIEVWDVAIGKPPSLVRTSEAVHSKEPKEVYRITFSPDGKYLATASKDAKARLWDADTCKLLTEFVAHKKEVYDVAFSPSPREKRLRLATASGDKTARVWDIDAGISEKRSESFPLTGHTDAVYRLAFSPDGKHLATASWDGTVRIHRLDIDEIKHFVRSNSLARPLTPEECQQYLGTEDCSK